MLNNLKNAIPLIEDMYFKFLENLIIHQEIQNSLNEWNWDNRSDHTYGYDKNTPAEYLLKKKNSIWEKDLFLNIADKKDFLFFWEMVSRD